MILVFCVIACCLCKKDQNAEASIAVAEDHVYEEIGMDRQSTPVEDREVALVGQQEPERALVVQLLQSEELKKAVEDKRQGINENEN